MDGKTSFEDVIGGTPEEKRAALEELQGDFEKKEPRFAVHELEKTEQEKEIIGRVEDIVDAMVKQWKGDPARLPMEKIYILQPGTMEAITEGKSGGRGLAMPAWQNIGVERQGSPLALASTLAHELFHLKSYKSAQIKGSEKETELYRSGFTMIDREEKAGEETEYFGMVEEAIVSECVRKFLDKIGNEPLFQEEVKANERIATWITDWYRRNGRTEEQITVIRHEFKYIPDAMDRVKEIETFSNDESKRAAYAAGMFKGLYEAGNVEVLERWPYREKFYALLDELVERSEGKFKDREEIFERFAEANFTGNYLAIARTIEGILGKGSFRKLANEFAEHPQKPATL